MMPGAGGDVNTTLPLVLNIALSALCLGTCVGSILSIIGIVFAFQATNAKSAGDVATAKAKAKQSMMMFYVSAGLGLALYVVIAVLQFLRMPAGR